MILKIALTWILVLVTAGGAQIPIENRASYQVCNIYSKCLSVAVFVTFLAAVVAIIGVIWRCL